MGATEIEFSFEERLPAAQTVPARVYTDAEVLDAERGNVFGRTWQLIGREDQAASPGSFFTAHVGHEPILVVRGADSKLRALSNVCRHRAGPVAAGAGSCQAFRCGYHGWSYALDGRLLNTPEFDGVEGFRKEDQSLPEFRLESWLGLLFVNLDPAAPSLAETLEDLPARLAKRRLEAMRPAAKKDWIVECNWKVYVDNYLEGYHIPIVHPSLMKELDYARYVTETKRVYSLQHSPIRESSPGRLKRSASDDEALYFWIYPNLMLNVYPDNFSTNLILPITHERTLTLFEWFFLDPDKPGIADEIRRTIEFSDEIQLQDIAICEAVQKGLKSRTYDRGRYSVRRENGVHHFHSLYARSMRAGTPENSP
ncbi:MAG TPA: SRPBCC family protein [Thermoanaerobaculia bacterium]|nr:SRPBCC family protein [Thermoanaerobaculia bacterium]